MNEYRQEFASALLDYRGRLETDSSTEVRSALTTLCLWLLGIVFLFLLIWFNDWLLYGEPTAEMILDSGSWAALLLACILSGIGLVRGNDRSRTKLILVISSLAFCLKMVWVIFQHSC